MLAKNIGLLIVFSSTRISNEFCDAELDPIYARIKEFEESIVSLGMYYHF